MTNEKFRYYPTYLEEWDQILSVATPEQLYQLVRMCIDYAKGIEVPQPEEPVMKLCFSMASGSIDRGVEKVNRKSKSARYSRYCSACNSKGTKPLSYTDWSNQIDSKKQSDERQRTSTIVNDSQRASAKPTNVTNVTDADNLNHNNNHNLNPYNHNLNNLNQSNKSPAASSPSGDNSEVGRQNYLPQRWEFDIPKAYWGRFEYEDDYYKYAQTHRDEVIAELEKEEHQKKR